MDQRLKSWERSIRGGRDRFLRWLLSGKRGRKMVLDGLAEDISAMTLRASDHVMSFSPKELIGRKLYVDGHFDRDRVEVLLDLLQKENRLPPQGATVLDVGANIGTQTVYFGISGKVSRILSIEPDPRNLQLLRRNISENGLERVATVAPVAIADFEGSAPLYRSSGNHGGSSLIATRHDGSPIEIRVRPLMPVLSEAGIPEDDVDLIWMDIEGAEPKACRSMEPLLAKRVPLILEFSPELYGESIARDFVTYLARFYTRAVVFRGSHRSEVRPTELAVTGKQYDVLLL